MRDQILNGTQIWEIQCIYDAYEEDNDSEEEQSDEVCQNKTQLAAKTKVFEQEIQKEKKLLIRKDAEAKVYKYNHNDLNDKEFVDPDLHKDLFEDDSDVEFSNNWL